MPEEKPFVAEHSCRLTAPDYDNYARKNCYRKSDGKCVDYVFGIIGPDESELQSLRYKTKIWTESAARAHCKGKKGTFEPAKKESDMRTIEIYLKSGDMYQSSFVTGDELKKWFVENTDKEGNVQGEIIVFQECLFKITDDEAIEWVLSDYTLDRDLERIDPEGWDLKNFRKNPVMLWAHDCCRPAIGKILKPKVEDGKLKGFAKFNNKETDEFGWGIGQRVRDGVISAGSVGFRSKKIEIIEDDKDPTRLIHRKQELFEFSIVNLPANINARPAKSDSKDNTDDSSKSYQNENTEKGPIAYRDLGFAPEDTDWDAGREVKAADIADLKKMCAWFDAANADVKGSYKLPHHKQGSKKAVWAGVRAAMGALMGARRPLKIPDADRRPVYNHLKKHYAHWDKEPPDFKEIMLTDIGYKIDELRRTIADMRGKREIDEVRDLLADIEIRISSIEKILKPQSYIDDLFEEDAGRKISVQDNSTEDKSLDELLGIETNQEE